MNESEGSELLHTFERELRQSTEQMQSLLLDVEQHSDFAEAIPSLQEVYRLAHSLKGASRVIGLFPIEQLAHALEDHLQRLLHDQTLPAPKEISLFLRVIDSFVDSFDAFLKGEMFEPAELEKELSALKIFSDSEKISETTSAIQPKIPEISSPPEGQRASTRRSDQILVPSQQLDELFRRMEEAFLVESRIGALLTASDQMIQEKPADEILDLWNRQYGQLKKETSRLHFVLMQFHEMIRLFRMVPVKRLKTAIQKAIRDLSLSLGKQVTLDFRGEHQMLDATVLEMLIDPVVHLIRNAVDHGIELPAERFERGKPAEGTILVDATISGGFLNLVINDDGAGINVESIRERAIELRLIRADETDQLREADWLEFLFRPGFSTAEELTEISGRGLGMDIVRRRIQDLGGNLQISTRSGTGTTFSIQVPIGLLTPRVLLVRSGINQAAFPIADVERVFRYDPALVRRVNGASLIEWDKTPIVLETLSGHLGWFSAGPYSHVVLLSRNGIRKGLLVDEILSEIEQVAFPPPWNLRGMPYLSGVIVMGNGNLVPVIETRDLIQTPRSTERTDIPQEIPEVRQRTILVVDDSPTIVALHRSILKNAGYRILVAENGQAAWDLLQSQAVDLLLTDIEMPKMNGIELIRRVRSEDARKNLPVIVISQYGAREDLQKAAHAGADRYIVKSGFNPQKLLEVVKELLLD